MRVLTDTGPLVAILSPDDQYHEVCLQTVRGLQGPLLTCWPVIAEAAWLLQKYPLAFERLLGSVSDGVVEILPVVGKEASAVADVMKRYRSLRAQFADAMLVYLANRENIRTIFTLDRRDFLVYRSPSKPPFLLLPNLG
jgi:predicted nucleic acid-binding protein